MLLSLMPSNQQQQQQQDQNNPTSLQQQQQTPLEFRIHNGNVVEKKSLSTAQSLLLQQRFIATNHLLKPCIPFLPSFSIIHENSEQEPSFNSSDQNPTKQTKTTNKKSLHVCNVCSKEFKTQALLRRHSVLHEPTTKHEHKCQTCSKTFVRKTGLRRHELCHTSSRPHICEECGKGKTHLCWYTTLF